MDEKNPEISPVPEPAGPSAAVPEMAPVPAPEQTPAAEAEAVAAPEPALAAPAPAQSTAPAVSNPFAAHRPAAPAPVPEPTAPYAVGAAAQPAAQPYAQPYGQTAPTSAAAASASGRSAYEQAYGTATGQPSYGAAVPQPYGAAPQQPYGAVPPTPPVPPAPVYGYEPPASGGQKRRWPWFLLGLATGLVIGLGGCVSCVGLTVAGYEGVNDYVYDDYSYDYDDPYHSWPPEGDYYTPEDSKPDGATTMALSYEEVTSLLETEGFEAGAPAADGTCPKGYYTVGPEGAIPAGLYALEGGDLLSHYYVFDGDSATGKGSAYDLDDSVQYLGNYFVELDEGDLIAFEPGVEGAVMKPAPSTSVNPTAPYGNGCYRVGVDIPAGTYTITAAPVDDPEVTDECAAYVMDDLDFDDDSIVDTQYVIPGGKQTVTVVDGQYLELFAATATPALEN